MYSTHNLFKQFINRATITGDRRGYGRFIIILSLSLILALPVFAQNYPVQAVATPVADEAITQAVARELRMHEAISAHLIDVTTHDGVVTLSGAVSHLPAKSLAASVATRIVGVRAVVNDLIVHPLPRTDDILRSDIRQALVADPATDAADIDIAVNDSVVTLSGTVASDAERQLVMQIVEGVKGIQEIENNLKLQYDQQWTDAEIQREIQRRFRLLPTLIPENIDVTVNDGHVTLEGGVGSTAEKSNLENKAWVQGVQSVDTSGLTVEWWASRRTGYQVSTLRPDPNLQTAIEDAFLYDPRVSAFDIDVEVGNQVVTLSGKVNNLKARRAAEQDARNTPGVRAVNNRILVRPDVRLSDDALAQKVTDALKRDPVMERYNFQVTARNHKVYLAGLVDSYYGKWWAEDVVARVEGVADIQNSLTVNYEWKWKPDQDLKADVEAELFWDLAVDSDAITVEVQDGNVVLIGKVGTWQELEKAVQNAFEGGAKTVRSRLQVRNEPNEYPIHFQYRYYW